MRAFGAIVVILMIFQAGGIAACGSASLAGGGGKAKPAAGAGKAGKDTPKGGLVGKDSGSPGGAADGGDEIGDAGDAGTSGTTGDKNGNVGKDGKSDGGDADGGAGDAKDAGGGKNGDDDGTDLGGANVIPGSNGLVVDIDNGNVSKTLVPQFGLLVNDLKCALCHVTINGDVASTSEVEPLWNTSRGTINGVWHAAAGFRPAQKSSDPLTGNDVAINVTGGVRPNLGKSDKLPKDLNGDGKADFPKIEFASLASKMNGTLRFAGTKIEKTHSGNVVAVGTAADPIVIEGEVLIQGDLVIKGVYKGIGNVYVTGNIWIPADLKGLTTPFPYPTDRAAALAKAKNAVKQKMDALGLATPQSILISDLDSHGADHPSVYEHVHTPPGRRAGDLGVHRVFNWIPGGKAAYDQLYEAAPAPCNGHTPNFGRSVSRIDAYLYAGNTIGGRANRNSYAINGGIIADHFHVVSGAAACGAGAHPIHGNASNASYVNYDWRMMTGLLLLKQMKGAFN